MTMSTSSSSVGCKQRRKRQLFLVDVIFLFLVGVLVHDRSLVSASDASSSSSSNLASSSSSSSFRVLPCSTNMNHSGNPPQQQQQRRRNNNGPSSSTNNKNHRQRLSLEYPRTVRTMRSWMIRHNSIRQQQKRIQDYEADYQQYHSNKNNKKTKKNGGIVGTRLTLNRPTMEQVERWYNDRRGGDSNHPSFPSQQQSYHHQRGGGDVDSHGNLRDALRTMFQNPFNHEAVGMTNPLLTVLPGSQTTSKDLILPQQQQQQSEVGGGIPTPTTTTTAAVDPWWPSLELVPTTSSQSNTQEQQRRNRKKKNPEWRVLTYRKCSIGTGRECYTKVRDAVLDWEFDMMDNMGMIAVPEDPPILSSALQTSRSTSSRFFNFPHYHRRSSLSSQKQKQQQQRRYPKPYIQQTGFERVSIPNNHNNDDGDKEHNHQSSLSSNDRVRSIWSGPGGKRFVTYGASPPRRLFGVLPLPPFVKVYAINPVMLVYDLVDQRAPGTTYTSTAYATMKGHLLCGEERVTVAWRDDGSSVDVEVVSLSKPAPGWAAKLIWPIACQMQPTFFQGQLSALQQVAARTAIASPTTTTTTKGSPVSLPFGVEQHQHQQRRHNDQGVVTAASSSTGHGTTTSSSAVMAGVSSSSPAGWWQDCDNAMLSGCSTTTFTTTTPSSSSSSSIPALSLTALSLPTLPRLSLPFPQRQLRQRNQPTTEQ